MALPLPSFGSVQASGNSRLVQIGTLNANEVHIGSDGFSHQDDLFQRAYSNVHARKSGHFVDRPALQTRLKTLLDPKVGKKAVIIQGLGGSGKTQLALDYVQSCDFKRVFWINASTQNSLEQDIKRILGFFLDCTLLEKPSLEEMADKIKNLPYRNADGWLWIIDNADNVEDQEHPDFVKISPILPVTKYVRTLITTRSATLAASVEADEIKVGGLEHEEALTLFWKECGLEPSSQLSHNKEVAAMIINEFENLPLAITLAGSTISMSASMQKDLSLYLNRYHKNWKCLMNERSSALRSRYDKTVATAWETSFRILKFQSPLAANLLGLLSNLDPDEISLGIVATAFAAGDELYDLRKAWCPPVSASQNLEQGHSSCTHQNVEESKGNIDTNHHQDEESHLGSQWRKFISSNTSVTLEETEKAFRLLSNFSFLQHSHATDVYKMHKVVHRWASDRLNDDEKLAAQIASIDFIMTSANAVTKNMREIHRLIKHLDKIISMLKIIGECIPPQQYSYILLGLGEYCDILHSFGMFSKRNNVASFCYERSKSVLGENYPQTLIAKVRASFINLSSTGDQDIDDMVKIIHDMLKCDVCSNTTTTLYLMEKLACIYEFCGRTNEADRAYQDLVATATQRFGPQSYQTLFQEERFIMYLTGRGRLGEAELCIERLKETSYEMDFAEQEEAHFRFHRMVSENLVMNPKCKKRDLALADGMMLQSVRYYCSRFGDTNPITLTMTNIWYIIRYRTVYYKYLESAQRELVAKSFQFGGGWYVHLLARGQLALILLRYKTKASLAEAEYLVKESIEHVEKEDASNPFLVVMKDLLVYILARKWNLFASRSAFDEAVLLATDVIMEKRQSPIPDEAILYSEMFLKKSRRIKRERQETRIGSVKGKLQSIFIKMP